MRYRRRVLLSIFMLIAVVVGICLMPGSRGLPAIRELLTIGRKGMYFRYEYSYIYSGQVPVSVQRILLPRENDRVVAVADEQGKPVGWFRRSGSLILLWKKRIQPGDRVRFVLQTAVRMDPLLNVVRFGEGRYRLQYTVPRWRPGRITRMVVPAEKMVLYGVDSNQKVQHGHTGLMFRSVFYKPGVFALLVKLQVQGGLAYALHLPRCSVQDGFAVLRFSTKLFRRPPLVRGKFSDRKYIPTSRVGDVYQCRVPLSERRLGYAVRYKWFDLADAGNWDSSIQKDGTSSSWIKMP